MSRLIPVAPNIMHTPCRRFVRSRYAAAFIGLLSSSILPCPACPQSADGSLPNGQHTADSNGKSDASKRSPGKQKSRQVTAAKAAPRKTQATGQKTEQKTSIAGAGLNTFALTQRSVPMPAIKPAAVPVITYFTQDTKDWVRAGQMVYVTMQGTAGGQAAFRVAGFADRILMRETAPGRYVGTWATPPAKPLWLDAAAVTGELNVNGANAVPMQTSRPLAIDTTLPRIENFAPAASQTVDTPTPTISADFADTGSGIDASSARLIVNGRDLTGEANVTTERIVYKPIVPLSGGDQSIQLIVSDRAGNKYQTSWHFTVTLK